MLLCAIALFVVSLGYGVVVPVLPELVGSGAEGVGGLSIVYAAYSAAKIGAQVPGGVWVDRAGGGRVLRVALVAFSLSLLMFMLPGLGVGGPSGPSYFAAARVLEGAATGLVYPAVVAQVFVVTAPERAGRALGTVIGVGSSGLLVGPVLGAALRSRGANAPLAVALAASLAVTLAVFVTAGRGGRDPARPARTVRSEVSALATLAATAGFFALALPIGFNKLTFSAFQGLLPLVARGTLHVGDRGIAALFVTIGVTFGIAQPLAGALADRFAPRRVVLATLPVLVGALLALAFLTGPWAFGAVFGVHILAQSIVFTATTKEVGRAFGAEGSYGGVFGLMGTLTDLATIVGPLVFLNVYGQTGPRVFVIMAGVGACSAVAYAAFGAARRVRA